MSAKVTITGVDFIVCPVNSELPYNDGLHAFIACTPRAEEFIHTRHIGPAPEGDHGVLRTTFGLTWYEDLSLCKILNGAGLTYEHAHI